MLDRDRRMLVPYKKVISRTAYVIDVSHECAEEQTKLQGSKAETDL